MSEMYVHEVQGDGLVTIRVFKPLGNTHFMYKDFRIKEGGSRIDYNRYCALGQRNV